MVNLCAVTTASVTQLFLRFTRHILFPILAQDADSKVKLPSVHEIRRYQKAIGSQYAPLRDAYTVGDSLKLRVEEAGDVAIQEMFFNVWAHDHYVGNLMVFVPSGVIIACAIKAPGNMHDSQICNWGGVYHKLIMIYWRSGGKVVVDSAFSRCSFENLVKSAQDEFGASTAQDVFYMRQATAICQSAK